MWHTVKYEEIYDKKKSNNNKKTNISKGQEVKARLVGDRMMQHRDNGQERHTSSPTIATESIFTLAAVIEAERRCFHLLV